MPDGRSNHGGRRPGAGRKTKQQMMTLAELMDRAVPDDRRLMIVQVLGSKAAAGDIAAAKLFLEYAFHKPRSAPEDNAAIASQKPTIGIVYLDTPPSETAPGPEGDQGERPPVQRD